MECIEDRALKPSFRLKANSQVFYNDDVWCFTGINTATAAEDFPVEDLLNLDLPEMEFQDGSFLQEEDDDSHTQGLSFPTSSSSSFSGADEFDCLSAGEFSVPVEELENLEWLSQFVEDSSPELSLLCPAGSFPAKSVEPVVKFGAPTFPFTFPRKSRTTRTKPSSRQWSLSPPPPPLSADSSSTTSSSNGSSAFPPPFTFANLVHDIDRFFYAEKPPPAKRQKRKPDATAAAETGRRCMHCHVQKTPQWRAGPLGPKTLCNACGVRFKSGRLFPEYRPACSPTFSLEVHSNSHRKVLEMRRRKEAAETGETAGLTMVALSQSA